MAVETSTSLVINVVSKEQYNTARDNNRLNDNEFYFLTDGGDSLSETTTYCRLTLYAVESWRDCVNLLVNNTTTAAPNGVYLLKSQYEEHGYFYTNPNDSDTQTYNWSIPQGKSVMIRVEDAAGFELYSYSGGGGNSANSLETWNSTNNLPEAKVKSNTNTISFIMGGDAIVFMKLPVS